MTASQISLIILCSIVSVVHGQYYPQPYPPYPYPSAYPSYYGGGDPYGYPAYPTQYPPQYPQAYPYPSYDQGYPGYYPPVGDSSYYPPGAPRPEAQVAEVGLAGAGVGAGVGLAAHGGGMMQTAQQAASGTRSLADLIDNMGAPFQGNSMLANLMPQGGENNLGGLSQAIRGTAQLMEQGVGTMSKFQGMLSGK